MGRLLIFPAVVLDVLSWRIVGWAIGEQMTAEIVLFSGELRRLELVPLNDLQGDRSITNFACCPVALPAAD